jgi:hypothetical protein
LKRCRSNASLFISSDFAESYARGGAKRALSYAALELTKASNFVSDFVRAGADRANVNKVTRGLDGIQIFIRRSSGAASQPRFELN